MAKFVFTRFNRRSEGDIEAVVEEDDAVLLVVVAVWLLLVEKDVFVACDCAVEIAAVVAVEEVVVVADICLVSGELLACAKIEHLRFELKGNKEDVTTNIKNSGKKLLRRLVVDVDANEGDIIIELKLLMIVLRYSFFFFLILKLDLNILR